MAANQPITQWARQNISHPLSIRPFRPNKIAVRIAGTILLLFAGLMLYALVSHAIGKPGKPVSINWPVLSLAIVIALSTVAFYLFLSKRKQSIIATIDASGITTVSNKFYAWDQLSNIVLYKAYKKSGFDGETKFYAVRFQFRKGYVYANYLMPDFVYALDIALYAPVIKEERVSNAYYR